jgi:hypothetical protein
MDQTSSFIVTALFDFEARNEHELSCRRGEELKMLALEEPFVNVKKTTSGTYVLRQHLFLSLSRALQLNLFSARRRRRRRSTGR